MVIACGSDSSDPSAAPEPPKIDQVVKMDVGLHVTWTNPAASCEAIEGERKAQMPDGSVHEQYKVVFTVPGSADNKHDASATENMSYTYRLRCKSGSSYSSYSNEVSGNPKS